MSAPALEPGLRLLDGVDAALVAGLARLVPEQRRALAELALAFAGSPLGGTLATAMEALERADASQHHLVAVAAGRAALLGAMCDALLAEAAVPLATVEVAPAPAIPVELRPRLDSLRQWLAELSLAGLGQLTAGQIEPVLGTLGAVQRSPGVERLAALTTGFAFELLEHAPTSALPAVPARRWADLWSRAMLATMAPPGVPSSTPVKGTLFVLGPDVRHHDHLVSVDVHGVLEAQGQRRFVRSTFSAWKVGAIAGVDAWNLVRPQAKALFDALAGPLALEVQGTLSSTGALAITGTGKAAAFDPFALDLSGVTYHPPAPRDRHPALIAIPSREGAPVDLARSSPMLDLSEAVVDAAVLGLRRWDEGWKLQPFLVKPRKGKLLGAAAVLAAADKVKSEARAVLAERASRLLRA